MSTGTQSVSGVQKLAQQWYPPIGPPFVFGIGKPISNRAGIYDARDIAMNKL